MTVISRLIEMITIKKCANQLKPLTLKLHVVIGETLEENAINTSQWSKDRLQIRVAVFFVSNVALVSFEWQFLITREYCWLWVVFGTDPRISRVTCREVWLRNRAVACACCGMQEYFVCSFGVRLLRRHRLQAYKARRACFKAYRTFGGGWGVPHQFVNWQSEDALSK